MKKVGKSEEERTANGGKGAKGGLKPGSISKDSMDWRMCQYKNVLYWI
jgi:hypothetical protein